MQVLYHGTGLYKYASLGESKYEGVSNAIHNILDDVMENGLQPQYDPFNKVLTESGVMETISLTKSLSYAALYASLSSSDRYQIDWGDATRMDHFVNHMRTMFLSPGAKGVNIISLLSTLKNFRRWGVSS